MTAPDPTEAALLNATDKQRTQPWGRCRGVIYCGSPFHVLCCRRADRRTGLCKKHRQVVATGNARKAGPQP